MNLSPRSSVSRSATLAGATLMAMLFWPTSASAGVTYSLGQARAAAGETITIKAVLFNDTDNALNWNAPENLVLQWRDEHGRAIRSLATLDSGGQQVSVPVNNFVQFSWRAVVPGTVRGLQSVSIEGEPTLMALDTTPAGKSRITGTPANVPVVDAGAPHQPGQPARRVPDRVVEAAGSAPDQGLAVTATPVATTPPSAFENFRNAISPYEPIYLDFGTKGGNNARLQLSFKYRLFTPEDPKNPAFTDNMYLGYTQTALWDLAGKSKPFIDTTYNPSIFWHKDSVWNAEANRWFIGLTTGVEHKSNGKGGADSRSLNDAFIQPEFNYRLDGGSTLSFTPRIKQYFSADSGYDYAAYAGRVDWKLRWSQDNGLVLAALYRQGQQGRHTTQLEAAWPLKRTFLNMNGYLHVQYFDGYGETLLGYNHKSEPQVRIGLSLVP